MSDDLTTDLAYFLDQIINGSLAGLVWTSNGPGILPTWQPGGGGGGVTLPIVGSASLVVLTDSVATPLIVQDGAEFLTLAPFNVGAGPFADDGVIRGDNDFEIQVRNAIDDGNLILLRVSGDDIQFGGVAVATVDIIAGAYGFNVNGATGTISVTGELLASGMDVGAFPTANPGAGKVWVDTGAANVLKMGT